MDANPDLDWTRRGPQFGREGSLDGERGGSRGHRAREPAPAGALFGKAIARISVDQYIAQYESVKGKPTPAQVTAAASPELRQMHTAPLVSVIIPSYNQGVYIEEKARGKRAKLRRFKAKPVEDDALVAALEKSIRRAG